MMFDIASMSQLKPKKIDEIRSLVHEVLEIGNPKRARHFERLIQEVSVQLEKDKISDDFIATVAVFFNEAFTIISSQKVLRQSELYQFLHVINHLPILEYSSFYKQTMEILKPYFEEDANYIKLFDRLQLLSLYSEIGYGDAAQDLAEELFAQAGSDQLSFYVMYQLSKAMIYSARGDNSTKVKLLLDLLARVWDAGDPEATLYLLTSWIFALPWFKCSKYYKALLYNVYEKIRDEKCLNTARVGYELFLLDDKQVPPEEKMHYYQDLIKLNDMILNCRQLHSLHFFAGNYLSGFKEQFHDSIRSFKASNYFLHKCWERLIEISKYLRTHSEPHDYKLSMSYVEGKFLQLSNQTSLRNNSYVENLQTNFETIEDLYREVGELSLTDSLSGQRNRRFMDNNLMPILALAARHHTPVCFSIMDIDDFKAVNDEYGHTAGDYILKSLGEMLSKTFRHSDVIVRYGGDEFLVVLFDTKPQHCDEMMQGFRQKVENRVFRHEDKEIKITLSIGAYCENFPDKVELKDLNDYINMADIALYEAKESGRNTVTTRA